MKTPQEWVDDEREQLKAFRRVAIAVTFFAVSVLVFRLVVLANNYQSLRATKDSIQELKVEMDTIKIP